MTQVYRVSVIPTITKDGETVTDHFTADFNDMSIAVDYFIEAVDEIFDEIAGAIDVYGEMEYPEFKKEQVLRVLEKQNNYTFECKEHLNFTKIYQTIFQINKVSNP
jgi:hypothetical protein